MSMCINDSVGVLLHVNKTDIRCMLNS